MPGQLAYMDTKTYYEYLLTREFASLIKQKLAAYPTINVTLYNQNYDLYQVMSGKKSGPVPKLTDYDYILEVHFNATGYSAKDSKGDGQYKGVGMYVNSAKKNTAIDQQIVKAISRTGFPIWEEEMGSLLPPACSMQKHVRERAFPMVCSKLHLSMTGTTLRSTIKIK